MKIIHIRNNEINSENILTFLFLSIENNDFHLFAYIVDNHIDKMLEVTEILYICFLFKRIDFISHFIDSVLENNVDVSKYLNLEWSLSIYYLTGFVIKFPENIAMFIILKNSGEKKTLLDLMNTHSKSSIFFNIMGYEKSQVKKFFELKDKIINCGAIQTTNKFFSKLRQYKIFYELLKKYKKIMNHIQ